MKCADCKFWACQSKHGKDPLDGYCRRYAPRPEMAFILMEDVQVQGPIGSATTARAPGEQDARWPRTYAFEWCGDFYAKRDPVF